jgi:hypothetical protein
MQRAKIVQEEIKENETLFLALRLETKNSSIIFLSENEDQLGTLAVALPQAEKMLGPPLSTVLLGDRNVIVTRMLSERLAAKTGKIALVSVFTKTLSEREAGPVLLRLFDKVMKAKEEELKE